MPDEKSVGQEPIDAGQEPVGEITEKDATSADQVSEEERFDAEYVKGLRREAAEYRKRLRELETKVKADEDAKLTEAERLQHRLAELERQQAEYERERQERTLKYEIMLAANKLGIVDADAAYKLVDLAQVEYAEDGTPKNLDKVLANLVKARPYLAGAPSVSATNPARTSAQVETEQDKRNRLLGRSRSPFDEDVLRAKGGGVFMKE